MRKHLVSEVAAVAHISQESVVAIPLRLLDIRLHDHLRRGSGSGLRLKRRTRLPVRLTAPFEGSSGRSLGALAAVKPENEMRPTGLEPVTFGFVEAKSSELQFRPLAIAKSSPHAVG